MTKKKIHFIGIGGAGMSGLAEVFFRCDYIVQGSDIKKTKTTDRLEELGIHVEEGHSTENIEGMDYVVYSSCITEDNIELKEARSKGITVLRRIEALNMFLGKRDLIAVSGAHGKTTTSSIVSFLLIKGGFDPTVFIGANVHFLEGGVCYGKGNIVVTEADESDGSFLFLKPLYSVCTNIDKEHMDYYNSMDNMTSCYKTFIENTKEKGVSLVYIDDPILKKIAKTSSKKTISYGLSHDADIRVDNIELLGLEGSRFDFIYKDKLLGKIELSILGLHNILNSLPAIGIAMDLGMEFSSIESVIGDFKGADRRFDVLRLDSDILLVDDYAHHPTEIKATLKTLEGSGRRIVVIFQPHRYSRTKDLKEEYGSSFDMADHLVITDIYTAHERPIDGVSAMDVCNSVKKYGHKNVHFVAKDDIIKHLMGVIAPGDAVFVLGAGDIDELPREIVKRLKESK